MATIVVFFILAILNIKKTPIIVGSMGATAFIVFAMPKNVTAKWNHIVGGYIIGMSVGSLGYYLGSHSSLPYIIISALTVGASIFIMALLDVEHPPASGVALSFSLHGFYMKEGIIVIVVAVLLGLVHSALHKHMKDII